LAEKITDSETTYFTALYYVLKLKPFEIRRTCSKHVKLRNVENLSGWENCKGKIIGRHRVKETVIET
jgi:hypothetical protein